MAIPRCTKNSSEVSEFLTGQGLSAKDFTLWFDGCVKPVHCGYYWVVWKPGFTEKQKARHKFRHGLVYWNGYTFRTNSRIVSPAIWCGANKLFPSKSYFSV